MAHFNTVGIINDSVPDILFDSTKQMNLLSVILLSTIHHTVIVLTNRKCVITDSSQIIIWVSTVVS